MQKKGRREIGVRFEIRKVPANTESILMVRLEAYYTWSTGARRTLLVILPGSHLIATRDPDHNCGRDVVPTGSHRTPTYTNTMLFSTAHRSIVSQGSKWLVTRRFISNAPDKEIFLRTIPTHPGISALLFNRPQSKNAISLRLLKARCMTFRLHTRMTW